MEHLEFNQSGSRLACALDNGEVEIIRLPDGVLIQRLKTDTSRVSCCAHAPDDSAIATAHLGGSIKLWETGSGRLLRTFLGHTGSAYSVSFDATGELLASGSDDGNVRIWDPSTGLELNKVEVGAVSTGAVMDVAFESTSSFWPTGCSTTLSAYRSVHP